MKTTTDYSFIETTTTDDGKVSFNRGGETYIIDVVQEMTSPVVHGDDSYKVISMIAERQCDNVTIGMLYSNAANLTELARGIFNGPVKLYTDVRYVCFYADEVRGSNRSILDRLAERATSIVDAVASRTRPVSEVEKGI